VGGGGRCEGKWVPEVEGAIGIPGERGESEGVKEWRLVRCTTHVQLA